MELMAIKKVIIVGAGPSGLILGLLLAKQGIQVELFDAGSKVVDQPRAANYASQAVYELGRAGVLEDAKARGFQPAGFAWRQFDGTFIAGMTHAVLPDDYPTKMVVLPLDQLGELLYEHIQREPTAQNEEQAWLDVETPTGLQKLEADYVIGCDGASSTVRRELFGSEYPGETLNAQIIATNVYHNFWDSNFVVHPDYWYMAVRVTKDGLWRVTYGDKPGLSREKYIARQPQLYEKLLPGNPKPDQYQLTNISPYKLQQRCAPSFRVGRVLLAADAEHLCNAFGGLGLTGGIADVGSLFDSLMGIHKGLADETILDRYSEIRKRIWAEIIDPMSRANFKRLYDQDPTKARKNSSGCVL